jgi:hypothetical protein
MPILMGLKPNVGHVCLDLLVCFIPVVGMTGSTGDRQAEDGISAARAGLRRAPSRAVGDVSSRYGRHLGVSTARIYPAIHLVPAIPTLWDVCND